VSEFGNGFFDEALLISLKGRSSMTTLVLVPCYVVHELQVLSHVGYVKGDLPVLHILAQGIHGLTDGLIYV